MRIKTVARRILKQLSHDKRTLALMIVAPLFLLTLIYFIFDGTDSNIKLGVVNAPDNFAERLESNDKIDLVDHNNKETALSALENGEINAYIAFASGTDNIPVGMEAVQASEDINAEVMIDGTSGSKGKAALSALEAAQLNVIGKLPLVYDVGYLEGIEDISMFDEFGSTLIGFLVFFFVFLVGGMAFLKERKSGTLERLLSTPIRRRQIILGYIAGFGIVTVVQSVLISFYAIYVLDVMMKGSMWYVLLITLLSALCALTLGMLVSTAASSEFQVMQFIPILILPQIFFCGLFDLSPGWEAFGRIFPLYYITDALNGIMFRNADFRAIIFDVLVLAGYCTAFIVINTLILKKYRRI